MFSQSVRGIGRLTVAGAAIVSASACSLSNNVATSPLETHIQVTPESTGIRLDYRLSSAQTEFRLSEDEHVFETANLRLLNSDVNLAGGKVASAVPFREFSLFLGPDDRRIDAHYPVMVRIGERGSLLYTPSIAGNSERTRTRFHFRTGAGERVIGAIEGAPGFVFLGPNSYVAEHGALTFVSPPELPVSVVDALAGRATALLDFYTERLRRSPMRDPVLVISYDERSAAGGFVGDVTPNGVILLQLTAAVTDSQVDSWVSRFLGHELFHLWNGSPYRDIIDVNGHWLREGSAEYLSWLAAGALWPAGTSLEERLEAQLAPCMATLGHDPLLELQDQRSQTTRYSCGALAQWFADIALRSAGRGDVFDLWAALLAAEDGYDVHAFERAVDGRAAFRAAPLRSLLRGRGGERWQQIFAALRGIGVEVDEIAPTVGGRREAALHTLLREVCTGDTAGFETIGLSEPPAAVILRTEPMGTEAADPSCGNLSGDPHLIEVNGHDALGDWVAILEEVTDACETRDEVVMKLRRENLTYNVPVRCTRAARIPRVGYRIRNALPQRPQI